MRVFVLVVMCVTLPASRAPAWTAEYSLHAGITWAGGRPHLAADTSGRIHLVYSPSLPRTSDRLFYRFLDGATWSSPQDLPGPNHKEPESDMALSGTGHVYVVGICRIDNTTGTPYTVYYWEYDGAQWTGPTMLSSGTGDDGNNCTAPCVAVDRHGDVHVVWSQDGMVGGEGDIMYRKRSAATWQPIQNITANSAGTSYGSSSPDLAVDSAGDTVHVVWHDDFLSDGFQVYYTRNANLGEPSAWLPSSQWSQLSTGTYGKAPRIFLDRNDDPNVFWADRFGGSENRQAYSRRLNGSWIPAADWGDAWVQDALFDATNTMQLVYTSSESGPTEVYYRLYRYGGAMLSELVSAGPNTVKAYAAAIALGQDGTPHVVWPERKSVDGSEERYLFYSTAGPIPRPDPVAMLIAHSQDGAILLEWLNPDSMSYRGTRIRYKTTGFPTGPDDGDLLCDRLALPGSEDSVLHGGLDNGRLRYYMAFAHDGVGNYASGVGVSAMPTSRADFDADGDVDQDDFGQLQRCLTGPFVPQYDRDCRSALLDADEDVDPGDLNVFLQCVSGAGVPAMVGCAG